MHSYRSPSTQTHALLLPVSELVHGHRQVCRELFVASIGVVVVLGQQVNIVQEDATPVFISEGLAHPNVQQLGSIKSAVAPLKSETETEGNTQLHMNVLHLKQRQHERAQCVSK